MDHRLIAAVTEFVTNRQWDSYAARVERATLKKHGTSLARSAISRRASSFIVEIQPDRKGMIVRKGWRDIMKQAFPLSHCALSA